VGHRWRGALEEPCEVAQMASIALLFGIQLSTFILALIAYYSHRHVPGFVPHRRTRPSKKGSQVRRS